MYLKELIEALEKENPATIVPYGFGGMGHSDRGSYENLAFEPMDNVSIGDMLKCAKASLGTTIYGYKGGDYLVGEYTTVLIGEDSSVCGEHLSPLLIRYMVWQS